MDWDASWLGVVIPEGEEYATVDDLVRASYSVVPSAACGEAVEGTRNQLEPGTVGQILRFARKAGEGERRSAPVYEVARLTYRPGYSPEDIAVAEQQLGLRIPPLWSEYLLGESVLLGGWLDNGEFFSVYSPSDIVGVTNAYFDWVPHRGAVMIADGGGADWLQLDTTRGDESPVVLAGSDAIAWSDTRVQKPDIPALVSAIEARDFEFNFDAPRYRGNGNGNGNRTGNGSAV